jgi:NAD(P)-dependent dehydrogenase (short-subunit alcohol dehydrogenase family)
MAAQASTTPASGDPTQRSRQIAIVTGAAHGIGEAIARRLGADGQHVILLDVDGDAVTAVAGEIPNARAVTGDVRSDGDVRRAFAEAVGAAAAANGGKGRGGGAGILVNAVAPADIDTDLVRNVAPHQVEYMLERTPLGRPGKPEEVAAAVSFLVDEATFTTGQTLDLSGGRCTY